MKLTKKQRVLLEMIHKFIVEHKLGPVTGEIAVALGMSPGHVVYQVITLEAHGWIAREQGISASYRSMRLTPKAMELLGVCDAETALKAIIAAFDGPTGPKWEPKVRHAIGLGRKAIGSKP